MERLQRALGLNAFIRLSDACQAAGRGTACAVAIEDVVDVAGMATTCGASIARGRADCDAAVVSRIRASGAAIAGKANLEPWAFGVTSANPWWGDVRHPMDPSRIPGGSSGGAAVAVATGSCDWARGADTGGSVRIPAALCGVVGIKPSHGAVPMDGVMPLAPSLDTLGVFAGNLEMAARALAIVTGRPDLASAATTGRGDPRLAVPAGWIDGLDHDVGGPWSRVSRGIGEIALPDRKVIARHAMTILLFEAAAVHRETFLAYPQAFPPAMARALAKGRGILEPDYQVALAQRRQLLDQVARAMEGIDVLLLPTCDRVAPGRNDAIAAASLTRFTMPFNFTGQPAITFPALSQELPVGIQLVGHPGNELGLVRAAADLSREWKLTQPGGLQT